MGEPVLLRALLFVLVRVGIPGSQTPALFVSQTPALFVSQTPALFVSQTSALFLLQTSVLFVSQTRTVGDSPATGAEIVTALLFDGTFARQFS